MGCLTCQNQHCAIGETFVVAMHRHSRQTNSVLRVIDGDPSLFTPILNLGQIISMISFTVLNEFSVFCYIRSSYKLQGSIREATILRGHRENSETVISPTLCFRVIVDEPRWILVRSGYCDCSIDITFLEAYQKRPRQSQRVLTSCSWR